MVSSIGSSTASSMMQISARIGKSSAPPAAGGSASAAVNSPSQSSSTTKTYDPADTNQDGTVSAQELLAYLNAQAGQSALTTQNQNSNASVTNQMVAQAYGNTSQDTIQSVGSTLSVTT